MARKRRGYTREQEEEIQGAIKACAKKMDYRRLLILQAAGRTENTEEEIAAEFGVSKSSVSHLISAYHRQGMMGVLTRVVGGNRRHMSYEEEEEVLEGFRARAAKGEMLEVAEIHTAYEEAVGQSVVKSVVYRMLKRHNWRKVMPRSRHPKKANPEEITAYKKNHG